MNIELRQTLDEGYIGSAYSPQVDITETDEGHVVSITYMSPSGLATKSYTVPDWSDEEQARAEAEAQRLQAEADRAIAEQARATAEAARAAAETARGVAEQARANAETARAGAEQSRAAAETAREQASAQAVSDAQAATAAANTAASTANAAASNADAKAQAAETAAGNATTAAGAAASAAGDASTAATAANTAAGNATDAATAANAAASAASSAATSASNAASAANTAADAATAAAESIEDELASKADKRGAADRLLAGASRTVLGEAGEGTFLSRACPTSADGVAEIAEIRGNTVVWNQLVGDDTSSVTIPDGHKYVSIIGGTSTLATSDGTAISVTGGTDCVFDLTLMYGAGNEPSTVAEFEARWGSDYKPYSAPRLLDTNVAGINDLAFPMQTLRGIPDTGSAKGDSDILTKDGIEYRIEKWTLNGTNDYANKTIAISTQMQSNNLILGFHTTTGTTIAFGAMSSKDARFIARLANGLSTLTQLTEDGVFGFSTPTTICFGLGDMSKFEAATAEAANAYFAEHPIEFYCVKAVPTFEQFETPIDLTYTVQEGGTEAWVVPTGDAPTSAPPTALTAYPMDAADLRDMPLSAIAPIENGLALANYAVGDYLVRNGVLYKVTTAIAAGESIPASSISATTVAAMFKSLQ